MTDPLARGKGDPLLRGLIALIGAHSCALGMVMLFAPRFVLRSFGFPDAGSVFFPSQAGIFLLILGICYLLTLAEPALVKVILVSKALAVVFLVVHAGFLGAPPIIWAAAAGDGAMLAALVAALVRHGRLARIPDRPPTGAAGGRLEPHQPGKRHDIG